MICRTNIKTRGNPMSEKLKSQHQLTEAWIKYLQEAVWHLEKKICLSWFQLFAILKVCFKVSDVESNRTTENQNKTLVMIKDIDLKGHYKVNSLFLVRSC